VGLVAAAAGVYVTERYGILIDAQVERSLPGVRVLLVDRFSKSLERGALYAFPSAGLEPWIKDGQLVAKIADGLPGDRVAVSAAGVTINGMRIVDGLILAKTLGKEPAAFERTETVPADSIFFLGRAVNSFDSRYWGPVQQSRVIGKVHILF
jgi:conjugal transfer pilin signal peptidase TrbI